MVLARHTDLAHGGEACDEDAVGAESGRVVLAELDEAAEAVQLHHLLRQQRVVAQSAKGRIGHHVKELTELIWIERW